MPLPPALLKRLANRGIVHSTRNQKDNEEIIAEDYDEIEDPSQYDFEPIKKPHSSFWIERMKRRIGETNVTGYRGCPNKCNIYHKCTVYCINRWGDGAMEPKRSYLRRRNRLLKLYPLPKNWIEMYDNGCAVYYYWNIVDDTVSWLPPGHPNAQITKSAAQMRRELEESQPAEIDDESIDQIQMTIDIQKLLDESMASHHGAAASSATSKSIGGGSAVALSTIATIRKRRSPSSESISGHNQLSPLKKQKARDLDKALRHKHSRRSRLSRHTTTTTTMTTTMTNNDPLDPMDPAAYSNIPRGKWSDGLIDGGSTKSGVDPTASGALFQMRPYPSPGAVLAGNRTLSSRKAPLSPRSD